MPTAITDEDYAAEPVPADKRISCLLILSAQMGGATSLFFMQITSTLVLNFGSRVALLSIAYASIAGSATGYAICRIAIRTGFGTSVLARRVLGFRGASLFSIIFAINGFVYFVTEAVIMGMSLNRFLPGMALWIVLPLLCVGMIPLIWFGMKTLAKLQLATFVLYITLLACAVLTSMSGRSSGHEWLEYVPAHHQPFMIGLASGIGTMNSVVFITGIWSADYSRFARVGEIGRASLFTGAFFQLWCFAVSGGFGVWFGVRYIETNPGAYFVTMLGGWGAIYAIATQLRINLANMYGSSIAVVNVLRQAADIIVSRHVVVAVFGVVAALVLMLNLMSNLSLALNLIGLCTTCFTCLVLVDFYLLRPVTQQEECGGGAAHGTLPDWRWSAVWSLIVGTIIGGVLETGLFGQMLAWLASLVAALCVVLLYMVSSLVFRVIGQTNEPVREEHGINDIRVVLRPTALEP